LTWMHSNFDSWPDVLSLCIFSGVALVLSPLKIFRKNVN